MNPEFGEQRAKIKIELSPHERELLVEFFQEDRSRPEYIEGELKLDFEHQFSDGAAFKASEDEQGTAHFELVRDGKQVFDFASLLPERYRFLTPTGLKTRYPEESEALEGFLGEWARIESDKLISIGDFKDTYDIFGLLHEIGHSYQESLRGAVESVIKPEPGMMLEETAWKQYIEENSKSERDAWAWALRAARKIRKETGTDLFEVIQTPDDLKRMIYLPLLSHRFEDENSLAEALEGEEISPAFLEFIGSHLRHLTEWIERERSITVAVPKANRLYEKGKSFG